MLARGNDDVDLLAHALFELSFAHTWAGDLRRAGVVIRELREGIDGLAGVRWIAWALWQRGCLAIYDNRPDDALEELSQAGSVFCPHHDHRR